MISWELIFLQSRVNHGAYDGDGLPAQNWDWPRGTWFQERLYYLRARRPFRDFNSWPSGDGTRLAAQVSDINRSD
jgi:hypothetical protein